MRFPVLIALLLLASASFGQPALTPADALQPGWNSIASDGLCSSGTPFQFFAKPASSSADLLIYFNGGGACWFGQACDLNSEPNVHFAFADMAQNNPANGGGIFDLANPENPFAGYQMVFVPYCTGDVHIGAGPREYRYQAGDGSEVSLTTYHNGHANSRSVLDWVYANYPQPQRIVVAGSSAGAIGASFYAGLIAEHYRQTPVVLIADGAGGYGTPLLPITHRAWNTEGVLPDWDEYRGQSNDSLRFEDFYIASANHNPNLTIAQYNTAEDGVQVNFSLLIGDPPGSFSLPQRILDNYQLIESAVDRFYSYTAGGAVHTILSLPIFYEYEVQGVRFVDWVSRLSRGEAVTDISCVREARGCSRAPGDN